MGRKIILTATGVLLLIAGWVQAGPRKKRPGSAGPAIEQLTPPKTLRVRGATCFGGKGIEEFIAAGGLKDGRVVAFGNAWGPEFPSVPEPTVLGTGTWHDVTPWLGDWKQMPDGEKIPPSRDFPNRAGFIAFYSPDLSRLERVVKFDWSVATITAAAVGPDDDLYLSGTCQEPMQKLAASAAGDLHIRPCPQKPLRTLYGAVYYEDLKLAGDSYVARLSPDASKIRWVWIFKGHRRGAELLVPDRKGNVTFDIRGIKRISDDGKDLDEYTIREFGDWEKFLAVNPADGAFLRGGRLRLGTGRPLENWTKPMLWGYDGSGKHVWQLYDWGPRLIALSDNRLLSSASMKAGTFCRDGSFLVAADIGGRRAVTFRSPVDIKVPVEESGLGLPYEGGSATQLIRIDPQDFRVTASCVWKGRGDGRRARNRTHASGYAGVTRMIEMTDGSIALRGSAGSGLWRTPGALEATRTSGGDYVAVLTSDLTKIRYCGYVPGARVLDVAPAGRNLVVVGTTAGKAETVRPAQKKPGGGYSDAYLMLVGE